MTAREDDMRDVARGDAKLPAPFPASVAAEEALSEPVALAGVGDAVWPLSSKEEADLRERWRQHVGHNAIRPDDTVARLLATLDAARSRPAGDLDGGTRIELRDRIDAAIHAQCLPRYRQPHLVAEHGQSYHAPEAERIIEWLVTAAASSTTTEAGEGPLGDKIDAALDDYYVARHSNDEARRAETRASVIRAASVDLAPLAELIAKDWNGRVVTSEQVAAAILDELPEAAVRALPSGYGWAENIAASLRAAVRPVEREELRAETIFAMEITGLSKPCKRDAMAAFQRTIAALDGSAQPTPGEARPENIP